MIRAATVLSHHARHRHGRCRDVCSRGPACDQAPRLRCLQTVPTLASHLLTEQCTGTAALQQRHQVSQPKSQPCQSAASLPTQHHHWLWTCLSCSGSNIWLLLRMHKCTELVQQPRFGSGNQKGEVQSSTTNAASIIWKIIKHTCSPKHCGAMQRFWLVIC